MPTLLQPPKLMPLPAALRYAREGYAIRRAIWDGSAEGRELAWFVYRGGVFFRLDAEGREVVQNDEMTREDFLARDWTLLPPECVGSAEVCDCGPGAVEAMPYPDWEDEPDPLAAQDATNPNRLLGLEGCQWRTGPCECGGGETTPPPWPLPPGETPPPLPPTPGTPAAPTPPGTPRRERPAHRVEVHPAEPVPRFSVRGAEGAAVPGNVRASRAATNSRT